jgi:hypothetical protein
VEGGCNGKCKKEEASPRWEMGSISDVLSLGFLWEVGDMFR